MNIIRDIITWCDNHSGSLSVAMFFVALLIGWIGGFFRYVRHRPKFRISLIEGPSFVTKVPHETSFNGHPTHRTVVSLYLTVVNIGSAATGIERILALYQVPQASPYSFKGIFENRWHTLRQTAMLQEFSCNIGEHLKVYPFLSQRSFVLGTTGSNYYRVGEIHNGISYYESENLAWGSHYPIIKLGKANIKLKLYDSYGKIHRYTLSVPEVSIENARIYGDHIGKTYLNLENKKT